MGHDWKNPGYSVRFVPGGEGKEGEALREPAIAFLMFLGGHVSSQQLQLQLWAKNRLEDCFNVFHQNKVIPTQLGPAKIR